MDEQIGNKSVLHRMIEPTMSHKPLKKKNPKKQSDEVEHEQ